MWLKLNSISGFQLKQIYIDTIILNSLEARELNRNSPYTFSASYWPPTLVEFQSIIIIEFQIPNVEQISWYISIAGQEGARGGRFFLTEQNICHGTVVNSIMKCPEKVTVAPQFVCYTISVFQRTPWSCVVYFVWYQIISEIKSLSVWRDADMIF